MNDESLDAAAREEVARHFSPLELAELTMAICQFALLNRMNDSLWMDLDEGARPGTNIHIEREAFERYASGMYPNETTSATTD